MHLLDEHANWLFLISHHGEHLRDSRAIRESIDSSLILFDQLIRKDIDLLLSTSLIPEKGQDYITILYNIREINTRSYLSERCIDFYICMIYPAE